MSLSLILASSLFSAQSAQATTDEFSGARPFSLIVPSTYDASVPAPLLIALHGFSQSGMKFENYLHIGPLAEKQGILYVHPDGTKDRRGTRFWNATPECCDYQTPLVDDDAYIMSIIEMVSLKYLVDPDRIYLVGHSNGGFMVNRMACRHADVFAAVVNISGVVIHAGRAQGSIDTPAMAPPPSCTDVPSRERPDSRDSGRGPSRSRGVARASPHRTRGASHDVPNQRRSAPARPGD